MMPHTKLRTSSRRGLTALAAVWLLAASQSFAIAASGPAAPRATRLQPQHAAAAARQEPTAGERLDYERDVRLRGLLDRALAGEPFSLEELGILDRFAFDGTVSELEADVVISRALYDRFGARRPLSREQELLLEAYEHMTARRGHGILDREQEILEQGAAREAATPGAPAGILFLPITGDWDGDGDDTVGIYSVQSGSFFLRNSNASGGADLVFSFGPEGPGYNPLAGDWDGDGDDTVGIYANTTGFFFLRNSNTPGGADLVFSFGPGGLAPPPDDRNGM